MSANLVEDVARPVSIWDSVDRHCSDPSKSNAAWALSPKTALLVCVPHSRAFLAEQPAAARDASIYLNFVNAREPDATGYMPELAAYDLPVIESALKAADTVLLTGGDISNKNHLRALRSWSASVNARANSAALAAVRKQKTGSANFTAVVIDAAEGPNTRYADWLDMIRFNCRPDASLYGVTPDGRARSLWEAISMN